MILRLPRLDDRCNGQNAISNQKEIKITENHYHVLVILTHLRIVIQYTLHHMTQHLFGDHFTPHQLVQQYSSTTLLQIWACAQSLDGAEKEGFLLLLIKFLHLFNNILHNKVMNKIQPQILTEESQLILLTDLLGLLLCNLLLGILTTTCYRLLPVHSDSGFHVLVHFHSDYPLGILQIPQRTDLINHLFRKNTFLLPQM